MFKRLHAALGAANCSLHVQYVPSADNPADPISRGVYPPLHLLLPPIPIPPSLECIIFDLVKPFTQEHTAAAPNLPNRIIAAPQHPTHSCPPHAN
ncbi:hypothetical protein BS17DRAFT_774277 [Gyrodon lividus]|nr:hypothetical protein BS17DRAFT_774277 [Gyrodon lividus]